MVVWHQRAGGPAHVVIRARKPVGGWFELTTDVLHVHGGLDVEMAGRQTEVDQTNDGVLNMVINNAPRAAEFSDVTDSFTRTESNGWGTADSGQAWTIATGTAANFSTDGSEAGISLASVAVPRQIALAATCRDLDLTWSKVVIGGGVVAATSPITIDLCARYVDADNFYCVELLYGTDDSVTLRLRKMVAGSFTLLDSALLSGVTGSGVAFSVRLQAVGNHLRARAWNRAGSEPSTWHVEAEDESFPGAGQVAVRAMLESGNTNSLPVTFAFDGLSVIDPTALPGRYTPGYVNAPLELTQGMEVEARETIGRRTYDLFRGTLQQPEVRYGEHENDAVVACSAVDRFGERDQNGRTFISTLGEYILDAGGGDLVAMWPLNEGSGADRALPATAGQSALNIEQRTDFGISVEPGTLLTFGSVAGPPMDDITCVEFNPPGSDFLILVRDRLRTNELVGVSFDDFQAVAVSIWYKPSSAVQGSWGAFRSFNEATTNAMTISLNYTGTLQPYWSGTVFSNGGAESALGNGPTFDVWQLLTLHLVTTTGAITMWVDKQEFTESLGVAATGELTQAIVDAGPEGSAACYYQFYCGDTTTVNRQRHLAQYEQGTDAYVGGLRWQRTDERFRTISSYAGMPEVDADYGTAWMQTATLAGKSYAQARDEAVNTEQGRAFVNGGGVPVFHSRTRTRYNF